MKTEKQAERSPIRLTDKQWLEAFLPESKKVAKIALSEQQERYDFLAEKIRLMLLSAKKSSP